MSGAATFTLAETRAMERAAARAWPPLHVVEIDGWQVRLSGGGSRRANSLLPLAFTGTDPERAIATVEDLYRAEGMATYVQVSAIAEPRDLDARLARRGYALEEPCLLLAKRLGPSTTGMPTGVELSDAPSPDWLSVYGEPLDAARRAAAPAVLARVPAERSFFLLRDGPRPVATALGVLSPDGIAVVECVATRAAARRSGRARRIMDALEAWAVDRGAWCAALQVVAANAPARALYERRGYAEAGRYHYRWRDHDR
jgi:GNAT superfamily N-acetyltransferase